MYREPLEGSQIEVERGIDSTTYMWLNGRNGRVQYRDSAIMITIIVGLIYGGFMVLGDSCFTEEMPFYAKLALPALCIFFMAWCIHNLYIIRSNPKPAMLKLSAGGIEYDTGTEPFDLFSMDERCGHRVRPPLFRVLRSKVYRAEAGEVKNLQLQPMLGGHRLIFFIGDESIELGEGLSEAEREWLYEVIKKHVSG